MANEKQVIALDASILDGWDLCKKYYELRYLKHLTQGYRDTNLDRGSLLHLVLKNYYTVLTKENDWDRAVESSIAIAYTEESDLSPVHLEEIIYYFKGYVDKYKGESWKVLLDPNGEPMIERAFAVNLYDSDNLQIIGQGIADLIVETTTGLAIVDHKKRSKREEENSLTNQRMMYTYAFQIPVFITNKIVFIKDPDRYLRQTNSYDKEQHEEWIEEVVMAVKEMLAYKKIGFFKRSPTSCDKFGGCLFKSFCNKSPSRRDLMIGRDFFEGERWDVGKVLEKQEKS